MARARFAALLLEFVWISFALVIDGLPQLAEPEPVSIHAHPNITFLMYPTAETEEPLTGDIDVLLPGQNLTMVFHGFKGDRSAKSVESIKIALLQNGAENVVVVDWSPLADAPQLTALDAYHHVCAQGVKHAATLSTHWLLDVMGAKDITADQVHLIGFSLGAHVAGVIGQMFNSSIAKIYGLDPPKFGYETMNASLRLDVTDAMFVNVIHTSAGILSYSEPIGHVDFFPNGDVVPQVGCPHENPIHIITCSHYFAFAVFAETIYHSHAFPATECESWHAFSEGDCKHRPTAIMGYYTPETTRGMYFMATKDKPPFGEEDPDNPLPDHMKYLLTYDKGDSIVNPSDVVNFLMHKETPSAEQSDEPVSDDTGSNVMKVKGPSQSTTTPDPPAFINSSSPLMEAFNLFLFCITGYNIFKFIMGIEV